MAIFSAREARRSHISVIFGPRRAPNARAAPKPAKPGRSKDGQLLEGLFKGNQSLQMEQKKRLEDLYQKDAKGVEANDAF